MIFVYLKFPYTHVLQTRRWMFCTSLCRDVTTHVLGRYRGLLQKPSCPVGASLPLRPAAMDPLLLAAAELTDANVRRRGESFLWCLDVSHPKPGSWAETHSLMGWKSRWGIYARFRMMFLIFFQQLTVLWQVQQLPSLSSQRYTWHGFKVQVVSRVKDGRMQRWKDDCFWKLGATYYHATNMHECIQLYSMCKYLIVI